MYFFNSRFGDILNVLVLTLLNIIDTTKPHDMKTSLTTGRRKTQGIHSLAHLGSVVATSSLLHGLNSNFLHFTSV